MKHPRRPSDEGDGMCAEKCARALRPYEAPSIESQAVFESTALLCTGKAEGQGLPCLYNMFS